MKIIVSSTIPEKAKINLSDYGELIEFSTHNITYSSISNHPDIFFCKVENRLIAAPNTPNHYFDLLKKLNLKVTIGHNNIGKKFPSTVFYNAVLTDKFLIHHTKYTDKSITDLCQDKKLINVSQAYCRCNLLSVDENNFITSDKSIFRKLTEKNLNVIYVNPETIVLPGQLNGFFGGCCSVYEKNIFILGSLKYFSEGEKVQKFLSVLNFNIIELYDGPLFDGGSIIFL